MSYFPTSFRLVAKPKNYEQTKDICEKSGDVATLLEAAAIQIRALFPDYTVEVTDDYYSH